MKTLAPRLDLAILSAAVTIAATFAQTPAVANETHTEVLTPQKQASGAKLAFASAKYISIKAEREAAVVIVETDSGSAIHVTSGTVTVRNLTDKSVVKLTAGTAYETVVHPDALRRQPEAFLDKATETIALFESKSNTSYLYRMDEKAKLKAEVLTPPLNQSYSIGDIAATRVPMSRLASMHFPPAGVVVWHPPSPALAEQGESH